MSNEDLIRTVGVLSELIAELSTYRAPRTDMAWHNAFDLENFKPVEALCSNAS